MLSVETLGITRVCIDHSNNCNYEAFVAQKNDEAGVLSRGEEMAAGNNS